MAVSGRLAHAWLVVAFCSCQFQPGTLGGHRDAGDPADDGDIDSDMPSDVRTDSTVPTDAPIDAGDQGLACPISYTLTNVAEPGSRYRRVTASTDWAAAELDCEDDGNDITFASGHLVVLDDAAERQWVFDQGTTDKWIGSSDLNTEGTLEAVTDQVAPHFGNAVSQSQPKDCMFTNQTETVMEACSGGFQYICECDGLAADPANF